MAGYCGYSKSNNAVAAEDEGKYPLTRAARIVARQAGVTVKHAREALEAVGACEWHHTSKMYNKTKYYSVAAAVQWIQLTPVRVAFTRDLRDGFYAAYRHGDQACIEALAGRLDTTHEALVTVYYGTYGDAA